MKRIPLLKIGMALIFMLGVLWLPTPETSASPGFDPPKPTATPPPETTDGTKDIPPGYTIIEGDIQVPIAWVNGDLASPDATWATNFWPNGVIPFEFNANVTPANRTLMVAAMTTWENTANVDFVARTNEVDYIHVQNSTGNNSATGRQGGQQIINIFNWGTWGTLRHELAHALGIWHEQSRPDRDSFVQINLGNVQAGREGNFDKHADAGQYGPYDFDSVMHYGQCAFTKATNCPTSGTTITVLAPNQTWQSRIGQRSHLSRLDGLTMSFLYPEGNWRFADRNFGGTENGTFFGPYRSFVTGINNTPNSGTLWVQPGNYAAVGTYNRPMTIQAPLGGVVLGQ